MPLDFNLIEKSIDYSRKQLNQSVKTNCPYICQLNDFIYQPLLEKFLNYLHNYQNWQDSTPHINGRKILNWEFDTVVEEIHICMESLTIDINQLLSTNHEKFLGLNIWKDVNPFSIPRHTDNPVIGTSLQIYLNSCESNLGTKFSYNDEDINLPYTSNSGYITNNDFRVEHWMNTPIPLNYQRYSLYAIWSKK
jgi:hypothetical protein